MRGRDNSSTATATHRLLRIRTGPTWPAIQARFYVKYWRRRLCGNARAASGCAARQLENESPMTWRCPFCRRRSLPDRLGGDEIATRFHATARCWCAPEPADRLDQRRRLRHRQREGLHAGRRAGAQPAGGNREAVAEHVIGMMLCLAKRIVEVDRAMRRRRISTQRFMATTCSQDHRIIGIGHVGSRIAELCRLLDMRVLACDPT